MRHQGSRLAIAAIVMFWASSAFANVGKVLFVIGGASAERGATAIAIQRGFVVEEGDVLVTGLSGRMHVRMNDGALISLRPDTRFQIENYDTPEPAMSDKSVDSRQESGATDQRAQDLVSGRSEAEGSGRALMSLIKGGFRTITGLIGKSERDSYQVKTPVATIGIRGTDYSAFQCTGDCTNPDALYFAVWEGAVDVESEGGSETFNAGRAGVVINASSPPQSTSQPDSRTVDSTPEPDVTDDEENSDDGDGDSSGTKAEDADSAAGSPPSGSSDDAGETTSELPNDDNRPIEPTEDDDLGEPTDPQEPEPQSVTPVASGTGPFRGTSGFVAIANTDLVAVDDDNNPAAFRNGHPDGTAIYDIGTANVEDAGFDPDSGIQWGRWADGVAQVSVNGENGNGLDLTNQSLHYVFGATGDSAPVMPISGTAEYTLVGNTNPTDGNGSVGILGSASLSANFTDQTVDSTVNLSINEQVWNAAGSGELLGGSNLFAGQYGSVAINGSTEGNSGVFSGFFGAGASDDGLPDGAGLIYNLTNGSDAVTGAAVFGDPSP